MSEPASRPIEDDTAARALIEGNRRRAKARRWIAWCSLPFVLAALLFSGKVLSMYGFAYQTIAAYVVGDHAGSIRAAEALQPVNWFEPYKAPYDLGVGLAASGQLPEGQARFEEALELAHGLEVCAVRINLALVLEWRGDAAAGQNDPVVAADFYGQALTVTTETPDDCRSEEAQKQSPDPQRDMSGTLDEQEDRLRDKQTQQNQQPQQGEDDEPQTEEPDEGDLEELERRLQEGEQERQQNQQDDGDGDGGSGTDMPW